MKALMIGIGKKPGGPPPRPSGMNDMPGMKADTPDEAEDPEGDEDTPQTPEEFGAELHGKLMDLAEQCQKFFAPKDESDEDAPEESDDTGEYGPTE